MSLLIVSLRVRSPIFSMVIYLVQTITYTSVLHVTTTVVVNVQYRMCVCIFSDITDELMIECSSRELCQRGRWFHEGCVTVNDITGDWWCTSECQQQGKSAYCCRMQTSEPFLQCGSKDQCITGEYFHPSCIGQSALVGKL